jgi:hypothetical protein
VQGPEGGGTVAGTATRVVGGRAVGVRVVVVRVAGERRVTVGFGRVVAVLAVAAATGTIAGRIGATTDAATQATSAAVEAIDGGPVSRRARRCTVGLPSTTPGRSCRLAGPTGSVA